MAISSDMLISRCLKVLIASTCLLFIASTGLQAETKNVRLYQVKSYSSLVSGGTFSSSLKNAKMSLAHSANNPANIRLQLSSWSRALPGLSGSIGQKNTRRRVFRFYTPEHGYMAFYKLIHDRHGFGKVGSVRLDFLAYALSNGSSKRERALLRNWRRAGGGAYGSKSRFSLKSDRQTLALFRLISKAEAKGKHPYSDPQIRAGIAMGRAYVRGRKSARIDNAETSIKSAKPVSKLALSRKGRPIEKPAAKPVFIHHIEPSDKQVKDFFTSRL